MYHNIKKHPTIDGTLDWMEYNICTDQTLGRLFSSSV